MSRTFRAPGAASPDAAAPVRRRTIHSFAAQAFAILMLGLILLGTQPDTASAQDGVGTYVVQPGDTLSLIATRFGVSVESLTTLNGIVDPNLLNIGQTLLLPAAGDSVVAAPVPAATVRALPGETIIALARRLGQDASVIATLNGYAETVRLFPGQPVLVPQSAALPEPLRLGAITSVSLPDTIAQGHTGRLLVETSRPTILQADWNGTPLPFAPLDVITRQVTLLPVHALLDVAPYPLTLTYTTRAGVPITRRFMVQVVDGGYEQQVIGVPADRVNLLAPENVQPEEARIQQVLASFTPDLVLRSPFTRPIAAQYAATSPFGTRRYYDSGPNSYSGYHAGQDYGAPVGTPVSSPAPGIVVLAEPMTIRGNAVIIDHGRGIFSGYWHLSEMRVTPGQMVNMGDVIGLVGNTGLSTGAHLHWELRIHGVAVDPLQFMDEPFFP